MKSFTLKPVLSCGFVLLLLGSLALPGCSKSDDQKAFEREALRLPENITATDAHGELAETGQTDPDDWRISPMYRGHINFGNLGEFQPPYPNPVGLNAHLHIQINQRSPDQIQALAIEKIDSLGVRGGVISFGSNEINSTFNEINIPLHLITGSAGASASGLYRILIYDGRNNLISYGDVRIQ